MKIVKTAKLKTTSHSKIFTNTIKIYNKALSFYIFVCEKEYGMLEQFKLSKEKLNYIESITHLTDKHTNIKFNEAPLKKQKVCGVDLVPFISIKMDNTKLQYWAKLKIQHLVEQKAHSIGIRYSRILARGTSIYAYDGSGEVVRISRKDIARFKTGKMYHVDLSASYNIAGRYFIRAILKPLSETKRLQVEAKVHSLADRTSHTLSSLIRLREVA